MAGGIAAGIYPSDTAEQVIYKSKHSAASIAVVETEKQLKVFLDNKVSPLLQPLPAPLCTRALHVHRISLNPKP